MLVSEHHNFRDKKKQTEPGKREVNDVAQVEISWDAWRPRGMKLFQGTVERGAGVFGRQIDEQNVRDRLRFWVAVIETQRILLMQDGIFHLAARLSHVTLDEEDEEGGNELRGVLMLSVFMRHDRKKEPRPTADCSFISSSPRLTGSMTGRARRGGERGENSSSPMALRNVRTRGPSWISNKPSCKKKSKRCDVPLTLHVFDKKPRPEFKILIGASRSPLGSDFAIDRWWSSGLTSFLPCPSPDEPERPPREQRKPAAWFSDFQCLSCLNLAFLMISSSRASGLAL